MIVPRHALPVTVAAIAFAIVPAPALGQVFLATMPHPPFSIGPLFVLATVTPDLGPVTVRVSFGLRLPPKTTLEDVRQDLYILWPNEVTDSSMPGAADPSLR